MIPPGSRELDVPVFARDFFPKGSNPRRKNKYRKRQKPFAVFGAVTVRGNPKAATPDSHYFSNYEISAVLASIDF
jgi:hypothetical protein